MQDCSELEYLHLSLEDRQSPPPVTASFPTDIVTHISPTLRTLTIGFGTCGGSFSSFELWSQLVDWEHFEEVLLSSSCLQSVSFLLETHVRKTPILDGYIVRPMHPRQEEIIREKLSQIHTVSKLDFNSQMLISRLFFAPNLGASFRTLVN